jgi:hypothetical protein
VFTVRKVHLHQLAWFGSPILLLLLVLLIGLPWAGRTTPPGLSIELSTNDTVFLTVTNGTNDEFYEIYSAPVLSNAMTWSLSATGALGVTNFATSMTPFWQYFFRARAGNNWDGDGAKNFQDADPTNSNIGILSVTIDTPAHGADLK